MGDSARKYDGCRESVKFRRQYRWQHRLKTDAVDFRRGFGRSIGQLGELFQGQIHNGEQYHRCLLSLPCKELYSYATFDPLGTGPLTVVPAHKLKAKQAVELTLEHLGALRIGGVIRVESNIPEAKGYGSSTADCIASAVAAADCLNETLAEEEIAYLVVEAEVASGSVMFENCVLFSHREGIVLEDYGRKLPAIEVLGFDTNEDMTVCTLDMPAANYSPEEIRQLQGLSVSLRRAIHNHDVELLGRISTESACLNQRFLAQRMFYKILDFIHTMGALGVTVAHSGTAAGILLDPASPRLSSQVDQISGELDRLGIERIIHFRT